MGIQSIFEFLKHPAPGFLCKNLTKRSDSRSYLVEVKHVFNRAPLSATGLEEMKAMLPPGETAKQLLELYSKHNGMKLFVGARNGEPTVELLPFEEWPERMEESLDWFEMEDEYYEAEGIELPFSRDKLIPVAALNWSPDTWFLAADGAGAGKIYFWGHDGDQFTGEHYGVDLCDFVSRVFAEAPDCFGGIIRFETGDAAGVKPPRGTELYPERYLSDWKAVVDVNEQSSGGIWGWIRLLFSK